MKAFVLTAPKEFAVVEVEPPLPGPGQVVVDVERAGVCGTDVEFFDGSMSYLHSGEASYPIRIGHEWGGTVVAVGDGVDRGWLARRVTGDTMLGCGRCERCLGGHQHVCANRFEIGIRNGFAGALAEQLAVPASALFALPDSVDATLGALVEPGANALRSVDASKAGPGDRLLVIGTGTIGLLVAMLAEARGVEVHLLGRSPSSLAFARKLGFTRVWAREELPALPFSSVIDASNSPAMPAFALDTVEPAGRVVYVGLAGTASSLDSRQLVFKDVTAVGILSGSGGLERTIAEYASGRVDPRALVGATIGLDEVGAVLAGGRPGGATHGPKIQVDPRAVSHSKGRA